jgi:hypothetical protein
MINVSKHFSGLLVNEKRDRKDLLSIFYLVPFCLFFAFVNQRWHLFFGSENSDKKYASLKRGLSVFLDNLCIKEAGVPSNSIFFCSEAPKKEQLLILCITSAKHYSKE